MKPSFALSLSFEGIGLLHRSFPGWNRVGEVALDSPDLPGALAVLRETAEQINGALTCKLVIPNDQIKYLSLDLGVMSETERRDVIRAALDGATPYPVDELVYDWSVEGQQTQIAAVARDTLREAEDFATAHGFNPVSFAAIPSEGTFSGEPFFGQTKIASALLAPGEEVQRDMAPIRVTGVARLPDSEFTPDVGPEIGREVGPELKPELEQQPEPASGPEPEQEQAQERGPEPHPPHREDVEPAAPSTDEATAPPLAEASPLDAGPQDHAAPQDAPEDAAATTSQTDESQTPYAPEPIGTDAPIAALDTQQTVPTEDQPSEDGLNPAPVFVSSLAETEDHLQDQQENLSQDTSGATAAIDTPPLTFAHKPPEDLFPEESEAKDGLGTADLSENPAPDTDTADPTYESPDAPALSFSTIRAERDGFDDLAVSSPVLGGVTRDDRGHENDHGPRLTAPTLPIEDDLDEETTALNGLETARVEPALTTFSSGEDAFDDLPAMPPLESAATPTFAQEDPPEFSEGASPQDLWPEDTSWHADEQGPQLSEDRPTGETLAAVADSSPTASERLSAIGRTGGAMASSLASGMRASFAARAERRAEAAHAAEAAQAAALPDPRAEEQRMTVFGARKSPDEAPRVGGKPRYLGLVLTLVLLVFLAGVAAWASIFGDESVSRFFRSPPQVAGALPQDSEADTLRDLAAEGDEAETLLPPDDAVQTAAVAPTSEPELRPQPARPHALTEEEAQARYAVTGVWQRAPNGPGLPDQESADDLYTASIDPSIDAQDALALPDAPGLASDALPGNIGPTLAPGLRFEFDERGLVRATPEGTLNPEGVLIYAGKPPSVPDAARDQTAEQAPNDAADPETLRLSGIRPKPRPEGLVEESERQNLGGLTRNELAGKRPKLRPAQPFNEAQKAAIAAAVAETQATAQAEAIAEAAAEAAAAAQTTTPEAEPAAADPLAGGTALAVSQSRAPKLRPGNFNRIVERTVQAENTEPAETTRVAAAVPRNQAVAPAAPSKATVAKAATVRNQLNLRRVNLIGVYGKPSARRALVRLANGRYKKVKVGDRLDGGQVQAIGEQELRYSKGGRNVVLKMPRG